MGVLKMLKKTVGIADFSDVISVSAARMMADRGELEPLYLIGLRFGGKEDLSNCVFVPVGIAAIKDQYDDVIEERNKWAVRQYITGLRPVKHATWTNLRLVQYRSINGELTLEEVAPIQMTMQGRSAEHDGF